ncbi:MAG: hybrid sensor histidine kinase/response regulator [Hydrogenophaga sp.]|uniref:ATP-binding response regulator n=1 Tax=Hydrogenophaga sp. TaxID=1904254 RepID=UPI002635A4BF|nr:hybrid sensor histidine kinase/response regulator [Hydrogenophaga sp.]MDM7941391.1 hybrid sensor histidine kinase/response regulator [Hydrogenophaga sp.]
MRMTETFGPLLPVDTRDLSAAGRVQMLDLTFARHRLGISIMPLVAAPLVWFLSRLQDATWLAVWAGAFFLSALAMRVIGRHFARDLRVLDAGSLLHKWQPRIENIALLHGAGLSASVVLTAGQAPYEFALLLFASLACIAAANATHQNATMSVFLRFFFSGWVTCTLLSVWAFPSHWPYVLPLCLLFSVGVYRDALISHRFFVEQVRLEERSQQLIEQLKAARQGAELALQEKNLFLSTASHDLRQPIHAMSLLVEAIAQRNQEPGLKPLLADLKTGMDSMNFMFTSLLDLTRLENGTVTQRAAPVALKALLRDTAILFREQASQRGLALRLHLPREAAHVWADPGLLRQALVNLVHNALRYTERGGILIGLRRRDLHWQVEVWDTGVGIAEEDGPQIFSPWFRNQHAWRLDSAGHGLGLAVAARCARLMDATLGFQSRLARGSRFWLRLPVHVAPVDPPAPEVHTLTPLPPLHGRCLVLDDDPQVLTAWKALLEGWGVSGRYATTAREALQHLDAGFTPQAVFCDQRLRSGESGFEILKMVLGRCPLAAGAMVSGEFASQDLQEAEREGYLVLRKPLDPIVLHALLSTWHDASQP